jgi:hypothetical protein
MSVPLDNLYHWIEGMIPVPAVIYLFYPHGTKNISNMLPLKEYPNLSQYAFDIPVIMHDQEPLNYKFYTNLSADQITCNLHKIPFQLLEYKKRMAELCSSKNLSSVVYYHESCHEKTFYQYTTGLMQL